jgi:hypothetical protein
MCPRPLAKLSDAGVDLQALTHAVRPATTR